MDMPSECLQRFYCTERPQPSKDAEREAIARHMADYEAKHGPVETLPIVPVPKFVKPGLKEHRKHFADRTYSQTANKKRWGNDWGKDNS